jgi:hypothetical protein
MLAYAFLVVAAVTEPRPPPTTAGFIPLTCNEIQHPFAALVATPAADPGHRLRWSWWRRRRAGARACHDRRQAASNPEGHDLTMTANPSLAAWDSACGQAIAASSAAISDSFAS